MPNISNKKTIINETKHKEEEKEELAETIMPCKTSSTLSNNNESNYTRRFRSVVVRLFRRHLHTNKNNNNNNCL
jgi:hypothetical protein